MPTNPFEPLLSREIRKAEARDIINVGSNLLTELVNHGTNAFQRCHEEMKIGLPDEHVPLLTNYYHVLEMTDGIEVLISQSCAVPAMPLLRSSFEAFLSLKYILESDTQKRCFAWQVCYVHRRLSRYLKFDPSSQEYTAFKQLWYNDLGETLNLPVPGALKPGDRLKSLLSKPGYQTAEIEYQRLKSSKRRLDWFTFYGGPRSIKALAEHLERGAQYELMYRQWAGISHSEDVSHFMTRDKSGKAVINPLRNHEYLIEIISNSSELILNSTKLMLNKFRPGESKSFARWYVTEVQNRFLTFQKTR